jgi:hypothetical protein
MTDQPDQTTDGSSEPLRRVLAIAMAHARADEHTAALLTAEATADTETAGMHLRIAAGVIAIIAEQADGGAEDGIARWMVALIDGYDGGR